MEKIKENEREQGMRKGNNYWLEKANESARHFTKKIDWEQRRWELAVRIFMEAPYNPIEQTTIESLNKADIFIRQYRQILNTEE